MKKIFLLYITTGLIASLSFAQTGVNTDSPQGPFHVDAKGNTSGSANTSDDFIVDANGNVGVGTTTPTKKMHIESPSGNGFRLNDQSQDIGYMLITRDNMGTATWVPKPFSIIEGSVIPNQRMNMQGSGVNYDVSDKALELPPGVWMIMAKYAVSGASGGYYYWTKLHDLDDLTGITPALDGVTTKEREDYINEGSTIKDKNWYKYSSTSWANALTVVGMMPENKDPGFATPALNYIATISSPGKKPGDIGYEHRLVLTFSCSTGALWLDLVDNVNGVIPVKGYFFALRLDVDMNSL